MLHGIIDCTIEIMSVCFVVYMQLGFREYFKLLLIYHNVCKARLICLSDHYIPSIVCSAQLLGFNANMVLLDSS